jgi:serine/threonine protein kinase
MAGPTERLKVVEVRGPAGITRFAAPELWEVIGPLGAGAYGSVVAFRVGRSERCAVKKVERVLGHPVTALRTLREVKLLQHFNHPNILSLRQLYVDGPDFTDTYLCLDLMDSDLHKLIREGPGLASCQAQSIMYQMLLGLLCLRTANVVHRDMKPGNVLIKANGVVKIADFGLARAIDAGEDDSVEEILTEYVVTRYYRAPEIVLTATNYTYAVDMWSAGCILGEMLTSKTVFRGKDTLDQVRKIVGVIGSQPDEEMDWIPKASPSWKFVQECNSKSTGEAFQKVLQTLGLETDAADLLVQTLRFNPSRRIQVEDAVLHPYLESCNADTDPDVVAALDVPPMDWGFDGDLCFDEQGKPRPYDARRFRRALLDCCGPHGGGFSATLASGSADVVSTPRWPDMSCRKKYWRTLFVDLDL